MLLMLVVFLLMGLLINGLYQVLIKEKRNYGDLNIIANMPMHELMLLPKSAVKDTRWHTKTFHRPRRANKWNT